jgi:hypothetical protein
MYIYILFWFFWNFLNIIFVFYQQKRARWNSPIATPAIKSKIGPLLKELRSKFLTCHTQTYPRYTLHHIKWFFRSRVRGSQLFIRTYSCHGSNTLEIYRDATNGCSFCYGFVRRMKPLWNIDGLKPSHITFLKLPLTYLESPIVGSDPNNETFTHGSYIEERESTKVRIRRGVRYESLHLTWWAQISSNKWTPMRGVKVGVFP